MSDERPVYRPSKWYPERRDTLFTDIGENWEPDLLLNKYFYQGAGVVMGLVYAAAMAMFSRRPLVSGIQRYPIYAAIGWGVGEGADRYSQHRYSLKDAAARHYIQLHPELFPVPKRETFGEKFGIWRPYR
ncbi:unnamed protein product [Notodromas monacha]|uniref:NADH dehydrogenase [ubiquinone] 1 subunit C2 n=1 Tax=Notodromas monacha TaxID=399045 RepID=A0A7R9BIE8_9CRUS|nr:unnamed protein product [Notodromas monacha]CAG0916084.1 unnamed protein product [Notodromas monacha]